MTQMYLRVLMHRSCRAMECLCYRNGDLTGRARNILHNSKTMQLHRQQALHLVLCKTASDVLKEAIDELDIVMNTHNTHTYHLDQGLYSAASNDY